MARTAILLANLGSPDSYRTKDVRAYLSEFLMDERVIDLPALARTLLVKGIIVPFRAPKSAAKYKSIWTNDGSPLIHISRLVQRKLQRAVDMPVELCMRYAHPTPEHALDSLHLQNPDLHTVIVVPLYPHYAMSSYETAVEHVKRAHQMGSYSFTLRMVQPYYDQTDYIEALANSIRPYLTKGFGHLLFSYHGIPRRHVMKTDCTQSHCFARADCCQVASPAHDVCYRHQVKVTTALVAKRLELEADQFSLSFQSRLGTDAWLQPYTAAMLEGLPKRGIKKLVVVCPAFVSDCLETLEEIAMEGKEEFMRAGGEEFTVVPCLNDHDDWIATLVQLVRISLNQPVNA